MVVFTCMDLCEWVYVLHNFVAVVMCFAAQKKLWSYNLEYYWRVGWGRGDCVNVKTGKEYKCKL